MKRNKKEENVEKEVAKQLSVTQHCIGMNEEIKP
jgi:hypothetical protein